MVTDKRYYDRKACTQRLDVDCEVLKRKWEIMKLLFAVYLESLDQDLQVFLDKEEALAKVAELEAAGKPVKMETFGSHQICGFEKANGVNAKSPGFWEEITYDNGNWLLVETFSWHQEPAPEGYYAEYELMMR